MQIDINFGLESKVLEIRDAGTHIPALATRMLAMNGVQWYYIHGRCGYPADGRQVILTRLNDGSGENDPYSWGNRTMAQAHNWIIEHFDELQDGDVVDVEFILSETTVKKVSERLTVHAGMELRRVGQGSQSGKQHNLARK